MSKTFVKMDILGIKHICQLPRFATTGRVLFSLVELSNRENIVYIPQAKLARLLELSAVAVNQAMRTLKREDFIRQDSQSGWMINPHYFSHVSPELTRVLIRTFETLPAYEA